MGSLRFELMSQHPERHRMARLPHDPSLIWIEILHSFFVRKQHPPAAVSLNAEGIEDLFKILAGIPSMLELFPHGGYYFSACKTSYWYHLCTGPSLVCIH